MQRNCFPSKLCKLVDLVLTSRLLSSSLKVSTKKIVDDLEKVQDEIQGWRSHWLIRHKNKCVYKKRDQTGIIKS